jgi:hypothetical protein
MHLAESGKFFCVESRLAMLLLYDLGFGFQLFGLRARFQVSGNLLCLKPEH